MSSTDGVPVSAPKPSDIRRPSRVILEGRRSGPISDRRGGKAKANKRTLAIALALLLPAIVSLALFRLWPAGKAFVTSFEELSGGFGFGNYEYLFSTPDFQQMIFVTLMFNLAINPIQVVLALALALLIQQRLPGTTLWRMLAFAPTALPIAVGAIVWNIAFREDDGLVNSFLATLGFDKLPWLTSTSLAMPAIIIMACWVGVGYWMVFLLAGLNEIPQSILQAAEIDGAGWWRRTFSIVIPLIRRQLLFVLIAATVVNFLMFAPVQIMTSGGPNGSTNLIMYSAYTQAFGFNDQPLAAAHVVIVMSILLVIVGIQFKLLKSKDGDN
ncbi:MAG: sugar ABC transporter permease [Homoserinimonas sp.]